ncbi:MAG TPA: DNA mismatch repair endonuclease MutL [Pseudobdellovibrionaceae bacterium]|nr:DNA mismatch repair endonuclease MutL [Pseudobdellovibrionaceae bacterium]
MAIELLKPEVIDQIAAGEVVERPAHLIKELVENSLDAGSTQIEVHFSLGGRSVRIVDNGSGMSRMDLPKSLDRFATSKIATTDDIWRLKSFGFRGEALASIASVSEMQLISREQNTEQAYRLISRFGVREELDPISGSPGTSILIEKLFENVPARLKFLKSSAAESGAIKTALKALALANFSVEFKVFEESNLKFFWPKAKSIKDRATQVLEIEELYEGQAVRESVHTTCLFSSPHQIAKSSKNIWIFAQQRWIQDRSAQAAVMEAYRNLLMHGEYPYTVVFLDVDAEEIDVNIHPTKSQVKFRDPGLVFRSVQAAIRETLERAPWIQKSTNTTNFMQPSSFDSNASIDSIESISKPTDFVSPQVEFSSPVLQQVVHKKVDSDLFFQKRELNKDLNKELNMTQFKKSSDSLFSKMTHTPSSSSTSNYWKSFDVIGQIHQTYLVCQNADKMMLVDQHAAHERVLFEKIMAGIKKKNLETQEFLFPLAVDLTPEKLEALQNVSSSLYDMGISIEVLGPSTLGIKSAPPLIKESVLPEILEKLSQQIIDHGHGFALEHYLAEIVSSMACHSAVRAGQSLSLEAMKALLVQMDEYPLSSFCPHGRPVSVDYPVTKIERDFGRTV